MLVCCYFLIYLPEQYRTTTMTTTVALYIIYKTTNMQYHVACGVGTCYIDLLERRVNETTEQGLIQAMAWRSGAL